MNLLEINTTDKNGGAANIAYSIKVELEKIGHNVSMFVKQKHSHDANVFIIRQNSRFFNRLSRLSRKMFQKDVPSYLKNKVRPLLKTDINFFSSGYLLKTEAFMNADIIHCHNLHGNYFNLNLLQKMSEKKPVIWTLHDMWSITSHYTWYSDKNTRTELSFFDSLQKTHYLKLGSSNYLFNKKAKIYRNSKLNIVVPSLWLKKLVDKSILKSHPVTLIYNGIDTKIFKKYDKMQVRKNLGLPVDKKIITFLSNGGKNNAQKGWGFVQNIIDSYKDNADILFLCVGGKDEKYSANIKYIPYIDNKKILAQYYSASDIFLFTSLFENFPLTILEAMACGTPIVSFDVGGIKEVLTHKENGYLAKYKSNTDLLNGIKYILLLNEDASATLSEKSIQKINKKFTLDIMINNYLNFYKETIQLTESCKLRN